MLYAQVCVQEMSVHLQAGKYIGAQGCVMCKGTRVMQKMCRQVCQGVYPSVCVQASCTAVLICANAPVWQSWGEKGGKEERRAEAPPPPQPCSQKSTSSSEVLVSSQSVHGVHAALAVHCPLSSPWSRVPSLDKTLRQTTGQPWQIHTVF